MDKFMDKFERIEKIGEGAYGVVYKATDRKSGRDVALKKIKFSKETEGIPSTALREISAVKQLKHPAIIELFEVIMGANRLYLVFEFVNMDLKRLLTKSEKAGKKLPRALIKSYMKQLLEGIDYCHTRLLIHRDLKPQNLLVNAHGVIKIADFGLTRSQSLPIKCYTSEVVTLWYRAPEILLGCKYYFHTVDIWSLGCIFVEMINLRPLFPGDSEIDQLFRIFRVLGTPNESTWAGVSQLPYFKPNFPVWPRVNMREKLQHLDDDEFDLLEKLVTFDPIVRVFSNVALKHNYFDDAHTVIPDQELFTTAVSSGSDFYT